MTKKKVDWGPDVTEAFTKQQGVPSFCRGREGRREWEGREGGREGGEGRRGGREGKGGRGGRERVEERGLHKAKVELTLISQVLSWSLVAAKNSSPSSDSNGPCHKRVNSIYHPFLPVIS